MIEGVMVVLGEERRAKGEGVLVEGGTVSRFSFEHRVKLHHDVGGERGLLGVSFRAFISCHGNCFRACPWSLKAEELRARDEVTDDG